MKKFIWLTLVPTLAYTQTESAPQYGYSYFTLGLENIIYQESGDASSHVNLLNPILNTGGLYAINDQWDFSIDALATFSPQNGEEEWTWKGDVIQRNQVEYLRTATNVYLHYKLQENWRIIGGSSLTYQTFTRYGIESGSHNEHFYGTWEENSTDIFVDLGVAYDSGTLYGESPWKLSGKAMLGVPLWSKTENTQFDALAFNDFAVRANLEGTLSYRVTDGVSLGWYAMFGYEKRFQPDSQTLTTTTCNTMVDGQCTNYETKMVSATLPEAETYHFSTGLQAFWSF